MSIAVKRYVRAYLENNFGTPVDIRREPELNDLVCLMLREGSTRLDKIVSVNLPDTVELRVSKDTFFRYGFTFTKTETLRFNSFLEKRIKFYARTYIAYHCGLGTSVANCIRDFQNTFGFSEDVWPYDSIKKDFDRNGSQVRRKMLGDVKAELTKVFMEMLSESGTPFKAVGIRTTVNCVGNE